MPTLPRFAPAAAVLLIATPARAQNFVTPSDGYGWTRGDASSSYFAWDDFSTGNGPNSPDIDAFPNPLPAGWVEPTVTETTGTAFVTSTGNLYSFGATPLEFEVVVPGEPVAGGTMTVLLQTNTQGREVEPTTIVCDGAAPVEVVELYREFLGPDGIGGGSLVVKLWRFEVPADGAAVITFEADGESMSLDKVSVDTFSEESNDCVADVNGDGALTPTDFTAWINAYNNADAGCDQNDDGSCTPTDFTAWITNYNNGC
ncbi:MAG: hypothetical protein Phyf2KO_01550 [Phycisphaerales bacterium]